MWQLIVKGGWMMAPIFICSFFALAIIIERAVFFISVNSKFKAKGLKKIVLDLVRRGNISEALKICQDNEYYVTNILKGGLTHFKESKAVIKEALEDASLYEVPLLEKNLHFLSTVAHISPLLGLLGTVVGLVKCFYIIEQKAVGAGAVNPSDLAGGIWEALLTTVAGLSVAIPCFIAYNYFVHKVSMSVLEMEHAATELLEEVSK